MYNSTAFTPTPYEPAPLSSVNGHHRLTGEATATTNFREQPGTQANATPQRGPLPGVDLAVQAVAAGMVMPEWSNQPVEPLTRPVLGYDNDSFILQP